MDLRDATRVETLDLTDLLAPLDDQQWDAPSLCAAWRIRDVLAHTTAGAEGAFGFAAVTGGMLRYGLRYNRWIAADGRARGQQDPADIVAAFRRTADLPGSSKQDGQIRELTHVWIHGQDMCRPLGIRRELPAAHLAVVADFVATSVIFRARKRIAGLRLVATDTDWSRGEGPEVTGPAEALVMAMAGRSAALDDLSGAGKPRLVSRC